MSDGQKMGSSVAGVQAAPDGATEGQRSAGWPRLVYQRPWFAWRPVRLDGGGWVWFRTITKTRLSYKAGDYLFEGNVYALLP